jgi:hypothetical protein
MRPLLKIIVKSQNERPKVKRAPQEEQIAPIVSKSESNDTAP